MKEKPAIVLRGKSMVFLGIVALASVVLFAWPLLGEAMPPLAWAGMALAGIGVTLARK